MDSAKASLLAEELVGTELDGWLIQKLVDNGKSAAVFSATKEGLLAAIKVFDSELIERYGDASQLARIERELELRGHRHENLVSIYGGGFDKDRNLYYIVMEFLDGPNLKKFLPSVKNEDIPAYVGQLASAARFLENLGLVHRDIKPENIIVMDGGSRLILLDFGVVRPIRGSDLTDPEGIQAFIGTLQYSSPEFLLRDEKQDLMGYRALTFYQIGAVLHDLIVRRPIFEQFANPYAKLVNAVQIEKPLIVSQDVPTWLVQLAERCLLKNPTTRVRLLQWEDFFQQDNLGRPAARDRVAERMTTLRAQSEDSERRAQPRAPISRAMLGNILKTLKLAAIAAKASLGGLPPLRQSACEEDDQCVDFLFSASSEAGFPHGLTIRVRVEVLDPLEAAISCTGCAVFPARLAPIPDAALTPWFEGILDNVPLLESFEQFFFEAIDWCIQTSPGVDASFDGLYQPQSHAKGDQN